MVSEGFCVHDARSSRVEVDDARAEEKTTVTSRGVQDVRSMCVDVPGGGGGGYAGERESPLERTPSSFANRAVVVAALGHSSFGGFARSFGGFARRGATVE